MKLRPRLRRRLLLAGAVVSALSGVLVLRVLRDRPPGDRLEVALSAVFLVLWAGVPALLAGYLEAYAMAERLAFDRFFDLGKPFPHGTDAERWPRPPRQPRPRILDEPEDSAFWMKKLAEAYARLERFEELRAPETVLESARRTIRARIAKLSPEDALTVMRSWRDLDSAHVKKRRRAPPAEGSN